MGRRVQDFSPTESMASVILLAKSGSVGETYKYNFIDGSIRYYEKKLEHSFRYTLIDNIGDGSIRVSFNRPSLDISSPIDGAKTLKSEDSIYIEEDIWHISIYYIETSTVEMVLKSDKFPSN